MVKGPGFDFKNDKIFIDFKHLHKGFPLLEKEIKYLNSPIKEIEYGYHGMDRPLQTAWNCFINNGIMYYDRRGNYCKSTWYDILSNQVLAYEDVLEEHSYEFAVFKGTTRRDPFREKKQITPLGLQLSIRTALKKKNKDGLSLFMVALIKDRSVVDIINRISKLSTKYELRKIFRQKAQLGLNTLMIAIMWGRRKEAALIIEAFLDDKGLVHELAHDNTCIQDLFNEVTYSGFNVLMLAYIYQVVPENLIHLFEKLRVDEQINILKMKTPNGNTLFMLAAQYHPDMLPTILSQFKALFKTRPDDLAAILSVKDELNQKNVFELLIEKGDEHLLPFLRTIKNDFPSFNLSALLTKDQLNTFLTKTGDAPPLLVETSKGLDERESNPSTITFFFSSARETSVPSSVEDPSLSDLTIND